MAEKKEKIGKSEEEAKNAQKKYYELQMLDQQMKQMQQYLQTFDQQLEEIDYVMDSIKELKSLKKGDEVLSPVANGIFIKTRLEDSQTLRINVGNNTVVTKSVDDGIEMLEAQKTEIRKYREETLAKLDEMVGRIEELQLS